MTTGAQLTVLTLIGMTTLGCASLGEERARVRSIASGRVQARELPCAPADLTIYLDTDDGATREWIAGCNFKAIRVRCARGQCDQVVERRWREELYE